MNPHTPCPFIRKEFGTPSTFSNHYKNVSGGEISTHSEQNISWQKKKKKKETARLNNYS